MNYKISVCVSVHNTAKYLPRCLDCLVNQTLKDLEIVLINNGSTDNSEDIMHYYKQKFPERSIIIESQEDRGLAQGRQSGVNCAHGEYIAFLDADDFVDLNTYEILYNSAKDNDVDIVEMDTKKGGSVVVSSPFEGKMNTHNLLKMYLKTESLKTMLWLRIYRRSLFNKAVFPKLYTNNEDNFALPCLLYAANSIFYIHMPLHTYSTDNEDAIMFRMHNDPAFSEHNYIRLSKVLHISKHITNFIGKDIIDNEYKNEMLSFRVREILNFLFANLQNKSFNDKVNTIMKEQQIEDKKTLYRFIRNNADFHTINGVIIKMFGIRFATYKVLIIKNFKLLFK